MKKCKMPNIENHKMQVKEASVIDYDDDDFPDSRASIICIISIVAGLLTMINGLVL